MKSYGQFCSLAVALDVIGDRWNLLIIRNLILGPLRWKGMRHNLPGVAKNLLSSRLKILEAKGVIDKDEDFYWLTERGRELETILFKIAGWGEKHFSGELSPEFQKRERYLFTSLRRKIRPCKREVRVLLVVGPTLLEVRVGESPRIDEVYSKTPPYDADLNIDFDSFRALLFKKEKWRSLEKEGRLRSEGSRRAIDDLVRSITILTLFFVLQLKAVF